MSTYKPGAKVIKKTPKPVTSSGPKVVPVTPGSARPAKAAGGARPARARPSEDRASPARPMATAAGKSGAKITANSGGSAPAKITANTSARSSAPSARPAPSSARPAARPKTGFSGKPSFAGGARAKIGAKSYAKIVPVGEAKITPKKPTKIPVKTDAKTLLKRKASDPYRLFAICPGGLDEVLQKEVEQLPAKVLNIYPGGVEFEGDLEMAYRATMKLRTASRMLLLIQDFKKIFKPEELYDAIQSIDWSKIFSPSSTMAIYLTDSQSTSEERRIRVNHQFWALKAKDAIVDQFQQKTQDRPNVDRTDPDITIRLHLHDQMLKVYLDLSGPSLHERGYRGKTLEAPMKENLAAGLLLLAGWQEAARDQTSFYDPFCGSGTLLVEAALIATRTAPGLFRSRFGFMSWNDHDPDLFERVHASLKQERVTDASLIPQIFGSDMSPEAVAITQENLRRAGVDAFVKLKTARFEDTTPPETKGLMVTNPPYGVRLDEVEALKLTYQNMGSTFKHQYKGWTVAVIVSEKTLMHAIALKPSKKWALHNGGLESQFSLFQLY